MSRSLRIPTLFLALALALPALANAPGYRVIVNVENDVTKVQRAFLADAFLKKTSRWPDGEVVRPVDLSTDSTVRRRFTQDLLDRSVTSVKHYWQRVLFSGRDVPPPELETEQEVVDYVKSHPGAVGYVSAGADVSGVKVVAVE